MEMMQTRFIGGHVYVAISSEMCLLGVVLRWIILPVRA
jgi:hypothetical protein